MSKLTLKNCLFSECLNTEVVHEITACLNTAVSVPVCLNTGVGMFVDP